MALYSTAGPVDRVVLDRLTRLAAQILDVPVVCASLVDECRQSVVSSCGLWPATGAVASPSAVKRMVMAAPHMGVELRAPDGRLVGTLTVMQPKPGLWTDAQVEFLGELAERLVAHVDIGPPQHVM